MNLEKQGTIKKEICLEQSDLKILIYKISMKFGMELVDIPSQMVGTFYHIMSERPLSRPTLIAVKLSFTILKVYTEKSVGLEDTGD